MRIRNLALISCLALTLISCVRDQPKVVVITATFPPTIPDLVVNPIENNSSTEDINIPNPSAADTPVPLAASGQEYTVQAGDTLTGIAANYNVSLASILLVNNIADPNLLEIGQVIKLPEEPTAFTSNFQIIPDSGLVRTKMAHDFNIDSFLANQTGYIRAVTDQVSTRLADGSELAETLTASQIIERVAVEYSIDAQILLIFLEYRAGWLSNPTMPDALQSHPLVSVENSDGFDRSGLYKQLIWIANELNRGYYDWKYRGQEILEFDDGNRLLYATDLNAGTVALQRVLSLHNSFDQWLFDVSQQGFSNVYRRYFGDPFAKSTIIIPDGLSQPLLTLPFLSGDIWRFTGGFHAGWGSGSAWASLDFAPPDEHEDGAPFCYISEYPVTAVASGLITRNSHGALVLDLDGDGNEGTGWTILYLHLTVDPALTVGQALAQGDVIGYASCQGGFSTATHLHIGRRYNGEWIPADCQVCKTTSVPPFVMSNWQTIGTRNQEYQGYMRNLETNAQVVAEQGRLTQINEISW